MPGYWRAPACSALCHTLITVSRPSTPSPHGMNTGPRLSALIGFWSESSCSLNIGIDPILHYHGIITLIEYHLNMKFWLGSQASPHFLLRFTWRVLRQEGFTCVYRLRSRKTAGISE